MTDRDHWPLPDAAQERQAVQEMAGPELAEATLLASAYRGAFELAEDNAKENVKYVEVRYAPILHTSAGLRLDQVVQAVLDGLARAGKPLPVYGDGQNVRDWIHVSDHCRGVELALAQGRQPAEVGLDKHKLKPDKLLEHMVAG